MTISTLMSPWRWSGVGVPAGTTVANILAAFNDLFVAEVAANPATAMWQVAEYSAPGETLTLKATAAGITAGADSAARLMLFGGTTPSVAAIDSATGGNTRLYCGVAPTANVDAPQQGYTAGVPYTTGLWIPGGAIAIIDATAQRVQYVETEAGCIFVVRMLNMTLANTLASGIVGKFVETMGGEDPVYYAGGSSAYWVDNQDAVILNAGFWAPAGVGAINQTHARANIAHPISGKINVTRSNGFTANAACEAYRNGSSRYFQNVLVRHNFTDALEYKFRQIAYGFSGNYRDTISDAVGVVAHRLTGRANLPTAGGPWLLNFKV